MPNKDPIVSISLGFAHEQPPEESITETRKNLEIALAMLWGPRISTGGRRSPWRTFYATLAAQIPISVDYVPAVVVKRKSGATSTDARLAMVGFNRDGKPAAITINAALAPKDPLKLAVLLLHELEHVVRRHQDRMGSRNPLLWNAACDYVINATLVQEGVLSANDPSLPVLIRRDIVPDDLEEEVYERLLHEQEHGSAERFPSSDPNQNAQWVDLLAPEDVKQIQDELNRCIRSAATAAATMAGSLPNSATEYLQAARKQTPPWAAKLRRWISESAERKRSWRRINRRSAWLPCPAPGKIRQPDQKIAVVLDTSGSMSAETLSEALGTVAAIAKGLGLGIAMYQCDADVYGPDIYQDAAFLPLQWAIHGRGGTLMTPAAERLSKESYPLILWMTDGMWGDAPKLPDASANVCVLCGDQAEPPAGVQFSDVVHIR